MCEKCGEPVVLAIEVAMTPACVEGWDDAECREFVQTVAEAEAAVAARLARTRLQEALTAAMDPAAVAGVSTIEREKWGRL